MTPMDRLGRSLFVALGVGLAWGIRGSFGHLVGAMYPGAILGLGFAYVSGQRSLFLWMPVLAAVSAAAIGSGGTMSYGLLHGYAQADTFVNYAYGFLTLFLQGSAWGTFGGCLMGLLLERKPLRTGDWLGLIATTLFSGWLISYLLVDLGGFDINPSRNNGSVAFMGAALGQLGWLAWNRRLTGLRGALLGYVGFGLGMSAGRLLGNVANDLQGVLGVTLNHWNVMEMSCGFIGGFLFTYGMVDHAYPEPPEEPGLSTASFCSIVYVLGLIPLWHRVSRIVPATKLPEWSKTLKAAGHADPDGLARTVLWMINGACVLGFVGVGLWLAIHFGRRQRWAALPVLWLSGTMLLVQNLFALSFFVPSRAGQFNLHRIYWVIFGVMIVAAFRMRPAPYVADPLETERPFAWRRWIAGATGAFALVILLAGWINGPTTMKSARTRWPDSAGVRAGATAPR